MIKQNKTGKFLDINGNEHTKPSNVEPQIRKSSYVIVQNEKGILVIQSGHTSKWELPGGMIENNESKTQAAQRECLEETEYEVKCNKDLFYKGQQNFYFDLHGDITYFDSRLFFFTGQLAYDKPVRKPNNPDPMETEEIAWKPLDELTHKNCHYITHDVLDILKK